MIRGERNSKICKFEKKSQLKFITAARFVKAYGAFEKIVRLQSHKDDDHRRSYCIHGLSFILMLAKSTTNY